RIGPGPDRRTVARVAAARRRHRPAECPRLRREDRGLLRRRGPMTEARVELLRQSPAGASLTTTVTTEQRSYRVLVVPVVGGSSSGALVLAFDRTAEHAVLADTYRTYALVALGAVVLITAPGFLVVSDLLKPVAPLRSAAAQSGSSDAPSPPH